MLKIGLSAFLAVALLAPLVAQWKVTDKGIPRLQNAEPDLNAPAPRRSDGKPDLTGIWVPDPRENPTLHPFPSRTSGLPAIFRQGV